MRETHARVQMTIVANERYVPRIFILERLIWFGQKISMNETIC